MNGKHFDNENKAKYLNWLCYQFFLYYLIVSDDGNGNRTKTGKHHGRIAFSPKSMRSDACSYRLRDDHIVMLHP